MDNRKAEFGRAANVPYNSRQGSKSETVFEYTSPKQRYDTSQYIAGEGQFEASRVPWDEVGSEASEGARVWHLYNDESTKVDVAIIDGCNRGVDVLLVFTGLFSAVLTTFIIQSYQLMQPNPSDATNALLAQLVTLQIAASNDTRASVTLPSPNSLAPSAREIRWVNGLWFAALSCSLSTALVSMLAKQWIQFNPNISGTPRSRARQRQRRYMQLQSWRVFVVIAALPLLLHAALLLFFAGLIVLLWSGNIGITAATFAIVGLAYSFYFGSMWLSLVYPDCPYQHPISEQLRSWTAQWFASPSWSADSGDLEEGVDEKLLSLMRIVITPDVVNPDDYMDACALVWMLEQCSSEDIVTTALHAIAGLPRDFSAFHVLRDAGAMSLVLKYFTTCFHRDSYFEVQWHLLDAEAAEKYCRAWMRLTRGTSEKWPNELLAPLNKLKAMKGQGHIPAIAACVCALDSLDSRDSQLAVISHLDDFTSAESTLSHVTQCWLLDTVLECSVGWELQTAIVEDMTRKVIPILLHLFHLTKDALDSHPRNAIALTLQSLIWKKVDASLFSDENKRSENFYLVIIPSLAAIIQDPSRFGVDNVLLDLTSVEFSRLAAPILTRSDHFPQQLQSIVRRVLSKIYLEGRIGIGPVSDGVLADILQILHPPVCALDQRPLFVETLLKTLKASTNVNIKLCVIRLLEPILLDCELSVIRVFLEKNGPAALLRAARAGDTDSRRLQLDCMRTLCIFIRSCVPYSLSTMHSSTDATLNDLFHSGIFQSDFFPVLTSIISQQRWWIPEIADIWVPSLLALSQWWPHEQAWKGAESVLRVFADNHDESEYCRLSKDLDKMKDILNSTPPLIE
ncbi:hypothetical protein B0H34DRAFT_757903 [Crassisporium funariophilum]|nr:hypothetical protein B0H34DRAFT_757903 [Crassisporium funariophilum]